jgi:MEMO1 family protein
LNGEVGFIGKLVELKKRLPDLLIVGLVVFVLVMVNRLQTPIPIYPYEKMNWDWVLGLEGQDKVDANVKAAILPHDAASYKELTMFYRGLAATNPTVENIVVIAPNHFEKGTANIQTDGRGFQTANGILSPNGQLIKEFQTSGVGEIESATFEKEHGITLQAEYIEKFFPKVKFLPIVLKAGTTAREIDGLVLWLTNNLSAEKTLVLGSIDFSHYLNKTQADKNDAKTLAQIKSMNLTKLPTSDEKCEYLDSPMSLRAVIQYARAVEGTKLTVVRHDNTATIMNQPKLSSTTSHFYITFSEG